MRSDGWTSSRWPWRPSKGSDGSSWAAARPRWRRCPGPPRVRGFLSAFFLWFILEFVHLSSFKCLCCLLFSLNSTVFMSTCSPGKKRGGNQLFLVPGLSVCVWVGGSCLFKFDGQLHDIQPHDVQPGVTQFHGIQLHNILDPFAPPVTAPAHSFAAAGAWGRRRPRPAPTLTFKLLRFFF